MITDKLKLKAEVIQETGERVENLLIAAENQIQNHIGAKVALRQLCKNINSLLDLVDKDVEENKLPTKPADIIDYIKLMISRAATMAENGSAHQESCELTAIGRKEAIGTVISVLKKDMENTAQKLHNINAAIENNEISVDEDGMLSQNEGETGNRIPGVRPGMSIAQQRKLEQKEDSTPKEKKYKRTRKRRVKKKDADSR